MNNLGIHEFRDSEKAFITDVYSNILRRLPLRPPYHSMLFCSMRLRPPLKYWPWQDSWRPARGRRLLIRRGPTQIDYFFHRASQMHLQATSKQTAIPSNAVSLTASKKSLEKRRSRAPLGTYFLATAHQDRITKTNEEVSSRKDNHYKRDLVWVMTKSISDRTAYSDQPLIVGCTSPKRGALFA